MITAETLLSDITAFCEAHGISPTKFGQLAARDGHLVRRLQAGKTLTLKRIEQVQKFMAEYRPDHNGASDDDSSALGGDQVPAVAGEPQAA